MKMKHNIQKLWEAAKAAPKGKFIEINSYNKKIERFQINNLTLIPQGTRKDRTN